MNTKTDWIIAAAFAAAVIVISVLVSEPVAAGTTIQDLGSGITIVRPDTGPTFTCIDMGSGIVKCTN